MENKPVERIQLHTHTYTKQDEMQNVLKMKEKQQQ